jgi:CRP-like cAMP-binding protein/glyoxylase-like metal-dependent hydrolase (beta-lactamase superfamily II)
MMVPSLNFNAKKLMKKKNEEKFPKKVDVEVLIERRGGNIFIKQNGIELTRFREEVKINKEAFHMIKSIKTNDSHKRFVPPEFGITTLGNSHGFDITGSTSGFIIWVGGKGIMVDPPPFSSAILKSEGIHPSLIEKIILSHCHADHDSGAFHKILESQPVELLSTETILRSFLRKYAAITSVPLSEVNRLVMFRPVKIGHRIKIHQANFEFFYAFHSIPTIGFTVERDGKSFYFSGDTFYDPKTLKNFYEEKQLFNKERYEELALKNLNEYDIAFHEAGIPPIHTPQKALEEQNKKHVHRDSKCKGIFLYHCSPSSIKKSELSIVPLGIRKTLTLSENDDKRCSIIPNDPFRSNLKLLSSIALVSWLPISRMLELVDVLDTVSYPAFKMILKAGSYGSKFYFIKKGGVRIYTEGEGGFEKFLGPCDTFGESSIFGDGYRLANVEAIADTQLLEIEKFDFFWVFGDPALPDASGVGALAPPIRRMKNLSKLRREKLAEFINENGFVSSLSESQKNHFNMLVTTKDTSPGELLWKKGETCPFCFFVKEGKFQVFLNFCIFLNHLDGSTSKKCT